MNLPDLKKKKKISKLAIISHFMGYVKFIAWNMPNNVNHINLLRIR